MTTRTLKRRSILPVLIAWAAMISGYYAGRTEDIDTRIVLLCIANLAVLVAVKAARYDELSRYN